MKTIKLPSRLLVALFSGFLALLVLAPTAAALEIKDAAVEIKNDFILEPAKEEIFLKQGEKTTRTLSVVNRTDSEQTFYVEVEDFTGSKDPEQVVVLLGPDKGPYSLKDLIKPEVKSFKLKSKQRATFNVNIAIPEDAQPGGRYASVLVSTMADGSVSAGENKAKTISRIGALYFLKIPGPVKEEGLLKDFRLSGPTKMFYEKGPFDFELLYENTGNIYLTPSGSIEIKNSIGKVVKTLEVVPFFSMPASERGVQVKWDDALAFGRYTATVTLDKGYREKASTTDTMTLSFWVMPWKILLALLIAVIIVIIILRKVLSRFEIRKKK